MEKPKVTEVVTKIVEILEPLSPEERRRVIGASLTLLGDGVAGSPGSAAGTGQQKGDTDNNLPPRAQMWMRQGGLSNDEIQQAFHSANGAVEIIAEIPGKNGREKVHNAYIMVGIAKLLETGDPSFDDKTARDFCKLAGCFDNTNHSKYLNDRGNEFTGSKEKGWTLTAPGLKRGAALVKEMSATTA